MRSHLLLIVIALGLFAQQAYGNTSSVSYSKHWINRTRVHVVWVNLNDPTLKVTPVLAWNAIGKRQSFVSYLAVNQPLALMTGTFFSLKSGYPVGDIVIGGTKVAEGRVGSALAIKPGNQASIIDVPHQWKYSWPGYESVLRGGIRLVENGKTTLAPRSQGFRDPALFRTATRTAIGLDSRNRLLMVAVNKGIYLRDMAGIMKALGCTAAMSLDGGTSTGLAYRNDVILMPGRMLPNVLAVLQRPPAPAPEPAPAVETPETPATDETEHAPASTIGPAPATTIGPAPKTTIGPSTELERNPAETNAAVPAALPPVAAPAPAPSVAELLSHVLRNMIVPFAL
ncbi:MAG: phosphodiester glycosidase family protein [Armatimonadota bacterium]